MARIILCLFWVTLGLSATLAQAETYRYQYTGLGKISLPSGVTLFNANALDHDGKVYGTLIYADLRRRAAIYENGRLALSAIKNSTASVVNSRGTFGGLLIDLAIDYRAPALFHGNKVELIPTQPGAVNSSIITLNDRDTALLRSQTDTSTNYVLYRRGLATPIDFGPLIVNPDFPGPRLIGKHLNNFGEIAGTTGSDKFVDARGFRYDTRTGKATILQPLATDTLAWGMGINNRGDILGYSFVALEPYHENIGVWDRNGRFKTYYTSSTSSDFLIFNDKNLIASSSYFVSPSCHLITKPGVRFNLADLVVNLPSGVQFRYIYDMNNRGDMLVMGSDGLFLLKRLDDD